MAPNDPFETLLGELESRVMDDSALAEEWREALLHFSPLGPDPSVLLRFREWFLLENSSIALGTPPAVAWAPNTLEPDGPWARLLDSFFGIFQSTTDAQEGVLEDLKSRPKSIIKNSPNLVAPRAVSRTLDTEIHCIWAQGF